ncbi:hypothetical protein [Mycolicibacterium palauense]|uniref:hypothetical protein n=1 Tax=Mycolicibacterium palauense TaxID=2034511 RepID=UPI00114591E6|nr:hypothetical protein [Mycolicibacterium palauense]
MADRDGVLVRTTKKLGVAGFGTLAVSAALLGFGSGVAGADDLTPSDTVVANPVAEDGIRAASIGEVLGTTDATGPADVRDSGVGVPTTKGGAPQPGNLAELGYDCLFVWSQFCQ